MPYVGLALLATGLASGQETPAPPCDLVFSLRQWEGEYASRDVAGGVRITPLASAIFGASVDGSGVREVVSLPPICDYPTFSPGADWLYFQSNASGRYDVYRCRADGSEVTSVVDREALGDKWQDAYGYALSADGSRIAYTVHDGERGTVVVAQSDGSDARLVAPDLGYTYMAALDATGSRVALSGPARGYRLLRVDLPDGEPVMLTPDHPDSFAPQFTPDGSTLVFVRRDGDIYRIGVDGRDLRRLTQGNGYVEFRLSPKDEHGSTDGPHISPDGRRIAYIALRDGVPNVCVMDLDGSRQQQVTHRETPCGRVRWSPDGRFIAFVSFEGQYPQLFVVSAEGGEPRQLTHLQGAVYFVNWRPHP